MAHTYTPLTKSDNTYTPVSDVTPPVGDVEEKFTWDYIVPSWDTWVELLGNEHWCDWLFATTWVDAWTALTKSDNAFSSLTKSDNSYSSLTTPSATYSEVTK